MVNRGRGRLGCLFAILVVAVALYYGIPVVQVYWDYYKLIDEMRTSARFAPTTSDDQILRHLRSVVDDLELPAEAKLFTIRRTDGPGWVTIRTRYREVIELPFHQRTLTFRPTAEVRQ